MNTLSNLNMPLILRMFEMLLSDRMMSTIVRMMVKMITTRSPMFQQSIKYKTPKPTKLKVISTQNIARSTSSITYRVSSTLGRSSRMSSMASMTMTSRVYSRMRMIKNKSMGFDLMMFAIDFLKPQIFLN